MIRVHRPDPDEADPVRESQRAAMPTLFGTAIRDSVRRQRNQRAECGTTGRDAMWCQEVQGDQRSRESKRVRPRKTDDQRTPLRGHVSTSFEGRAGDLAKLRFPSHFDRALEKAIRNSGVRCARVSGA